MAPDVTPSTADGRTALCPGTYDPVTYGHLDIIERASSMFDRIVVGVVRHPTHKEPFFTIEERKGFLEEVLAPFPNVIVAGFSTLVVEYARAWGACALVKGLRAVSDFEWELQMAHLNKRIAPEIETVFLMSSPSHSFLSSSGVRELAAFSGPIADFVPPVVAEAFARRTL
jgi:pantetheine-phosphate adenylyltransferase